MSTDDKDVQNIINKMMGGLRAPGQGMIGPDGQPIDPLQALYGALANLEAGLIQQSQVQQRLSQVVEINRLTHGMIIDILVDKGLTTPEDVQNLYEEKVVKPIQKIQAEMQEQVKKAIAERTKEHGCQQTGACDGCECTDTPELAKEEEKPKEVVSEPASDVVLASERSDNVIKFPSKKK